MSAHDLASWGSDWAWSLPLIALNVMFHITGLGMIKRVTDRLRKQVFRYPGWSVAAATLAITVLHGLEAWFWAVAFRLLDALPNMHAAMLYSLNALTAYGHTDVYLERKWQLMGALESLNGWILFGLSAAFLFTLIQGVWVQLDRLHARESEFQPVS